MKRSDDEIKQFLASHGRPWESFFVYDGTITAYKDESGRMWYLIIEDDLLALDVKQFLTRSGRTEGAAY